MATERKCLPIVPLQTNTDHNALWSSNDDNILSLLFVYSSLHSPMSIEENVGEDREGKKKRDKKRKQERPQKVKGGHQELDSHPFLF